MCKAFLNYLRPFACLLIATTWLGPLAGLGPCQPQGGSHRQRLACQAGAAKQRRNVPLMDGQEGKAPDLRACVMENFRHLLSVTTLPPPDCLML